MVNKAIKWEAIYEIELVTVLLECAFWDLDKIKYYNWDEHIFRMLWELYKLFWSYLKLPDFVNNFLRIHLHDDMVVMYWADIKFGCILGDTNSFRKSAIVSV